MGGRPYLYGLSVGGYKGAKYALQLLKDEVEQSMILTGVKNVNELNRSFLRRPGE
jgi:isopentenyl diphosphate isomerase/L-lactate dehydrogenase-like FMN-dependent dehydrogenase